MNTVTRIMNRRTTTKISLIATCALGWVSASCQEALIVDPNGNVGIGTSTPSTKFQVSDDIDARIQVENTTAAVAARTLFDLRNAGNTKFEITNTDANESWAFTNSGVDFRLSLQGSGFVEMRVDNSGNGFLQGVWTENSDVNAKQDIEPVDGGSVLNKLAAMPISEWSYKDSPDDRHIGPMAQDFRAAFGLGSTNTGIATLDSAGVALAAIKELNQVIEGKNSEIDALKQRLEALERMVEQLAEPGR